MELSRRCTLDGLWGISMKMFCITCCLCHIRSGPRCCGASNYRFYREVVTKSNGESRDIMEILRAYWWVVAVAAVIGVAGATYYALGGWRWRC